MKPVRRRRASRSAPSRGLAELRARLADAEEALRAIGAGEVDAVVVAGERGPQVFTLEGAERDYRMLIECMNEGALILTADKTILYANRRFARMVKCPLEQVIGGSLRRFLSAEDRAALRPLLRRPDASGSRTQLLLRAEDGSHIAAQFSVRPLPRRLKRAVVGVVVTDMTDARRNEKALRALTHRVEQAQEDERGSVAVELHDDVTQQLCAALVRSQALANALSSHDGPAKDEATRLREMLGRTAQDVERISQGLRPSVLEHLGLGAVVRAAGAEFADRTGVPVKLACARLPARLPADVEMTLYRVLRESLQNVERHARARQVAVRLTQRGDLVRLTIKDDGNGFDPDRRPDGRRKNPGIGLLSMRERVVYAGGAFTVRSDRRAGTEIEVRIPVAPVAAADGNGDLSGPLRAFPARRPRTTSSPRRANGPRPSSPSWRRRAQTSA